MALQTAIGRRQQTEIDCLTAARQNLQDEHALRPAAPARRDNADIDRDTQQVTENLNAQQALQDATTTAVRQADELLGYLIMHSTKPNSEPNNLIRRLQRTSVGKLSDSSDINTPQELAYNGTPCYRASYIHNLDGQRHRNSSSFKNGYKTSQPTR